MEGLARMGTQPQRWKRCQSERSTCAQPGCRWAGTARPRCCQSAQWRRCQMHWHRACRTAACRSGRRSLFSSHSQAARAVFTQAAKVFDAKATNLPKKRLNAATAAPKVPVPIAQHKHGGASGAHDPHLSGRSIRGAPDGMGQGEPALLHDRSIP